MPAVIVMDRNVDPDAETDRGPRDGRAGPERTCIVTRSVQSPAAMLRFVVGPDGTVVPDLAGRLPGRGAWVTATRVAVEAATQRRAFSRAFRRDLVADGELANLVDCLLERAALEALALANKAGAVVAGSTKVETALGEGRVAALIHAREAAADGVEQLDRRLARQTGAPASAPILREFTVEQLSLALGRANVVHAAVLAGPASGGFLARTKRLDHYRTGGCPAVGVSRNRARD